MRILVIGASGLVGSHVLAECIARGHTAIGTFRNYPMPGLVQMDLADDYAVCALLDTFKPDWVVHAAGWTWVDGCEKDPDRAYRENCEQPTRLAEHCKKRHTRFAYFSTTYVFDGTAGPYSEDDKPNPINIYAKSKWKAELNIQSALEGSALIPRVICVWGKETQQKNFAYQTIKALRDQRPFLVPSDQIGNPTWAGDIAIWLLALMQMGKSGVWNIGNSKSMTRAEWAQSIYMGAKHANMLNGSKEPKICPVGTLNLNQTAPRPLNSSLRIDKILTLHPKYCRAPHEISDLLHE